MGRLTALIPRRNLSFPIHCVLSRITLFPKVEHGAEIVASALIFTSRRGHDEPPNGWPISCRPAPETAKIALIRTPQAVTLDGRVGRLFEWTHAGSLRADYARTDA
jgi:hypothetical protein